jgi:hypothetical protein
MSELRQLDDEDLKGPFDTVAQLAHSARATIEEHGVRLTERTEHDEAGPVRVAAVELGDGSQFLLVEHFAHPDRFMELRAQPSRGTGRETTARFASAVGLTSSEITLGVGLVMRGDKAKTSGLATRFARRTRTRRQR